MNCYRFDLSDMSNLQEQVKKTFSYQKLFWSFTVWINCSIDPKIFANSQPSASNFKSVSQSLEYFFLTVGQNNFGNRIPLLEITVFTENSISLTQKDELICRELSLESGINVGLWLLILRLFSRATSLFKGATINNFLIF